MQTAYFTLTARKVLETDGTSAAVPERRRLVCLSAREVGDGPSGRGKIINFSDWAGSGGAAEPPQPELREDDPAGAAPRRGAAGGRRWMQALLQAGELLATCSVIGVMALLMVRLLAF